MHVDVTIKRDWWLALGSRIEAVNSTRPTSNPRRNSVLVEHTLSELTQLMFDESLPDQSPPGIEQDPDFCFMAIEGEKTTVKMLRPAFDHEEAISETRHIT